MKKKFFDWLHYVLIAVVGLLVWDSHQKALTMQSAERLIRAQSSALDSAHRALDSTTEYKKFKSGQEVFPAR